MDPVVVVGAGPVGQTAALLLARWGVPSVLLDGRPRRDPVGSKAMVQQRDVIDIWCAAGAGDRIAAEGLMWTVARTFHRDRELFATRFADRGASPLPAFVNISQSRTEELLDERIRATPAIEVRWDHQVTGIDQDAGGVTVHCGHTSVRGTHAIVAAGARGERLREQLGISFEGESFTDSFLICDIRTDLGDWRHERRFYFDPGWNPGRQVLVHPCPDSTYRIDWQLPPDSDPDPHTLIRAVIGDRPYELLWHSVYRFHSRIADRFAVGRVLLAGDVAHLLSPFGARGLNSGVQDAENAAWKIAYVRNGWADPRLLDSYHDERHAAAVENLAVTTATMDFLIPRDAAAAQRRAHALAHEPSTVDSGRLAEPYWYPDSPLNTPDPTRPVPSRPARGETPVPAPGVLVPDFPITGGRRFRELVRTGLLVLTPGDLATLDPSGVGRKALGIRPGEHWLIRPDGHIAAILPDGTGLAAARRRALGAAH
jgi:3-(3-hydroxy-phenyl)propionate hydroxylase